MGESTFCLQQASTQRVLDNHIRLGAFLAGEPHSLGASLAAFLTFLRPL
jgi:hypothetical protein